MARRSKPSTTLLAAVRHHFGLPQRELAAFLGISTAQVSHLEAGRRSLTTPVLLRLNPLAALLPAAPAAPPAEAAGLAPPAAAPLLARLDQCQHEAREVRRAMRGPAKQAAQARRWQQVLPGLLAATPAPAAAGAPPEAARAHRWLLARQADATAALDGEAAARYHLLRLRAEALEAEAAGLAALLPPVPEPQLGVG